MLANTRDEPARTAQTKYRIPRARGTAVARARLIPRLRSAVLSQPLTVLVAPAGYGKTTTLSQLAGALGGARVAWISLDEDDRDPDRLFGHLIHALRPLGLHYEQDPAALVAAVAAGGARSRAAIGVLVNALGTIPASRLVLMLDDVHHVAEAGVGPLLEALVERLPDNVSLLLAGRALPPLPLARWIVRDEAAEFGLADLGFDEVEARSLAEAVAGTGTAAADVSCLWERTAGWPAGFAMLLRASDDSRRSAPSVADARLYEFLADEVLAGLPAELQRFAEDVAVLAELTPSNCAVVSQRHDAADLLQALQERDVFVTVLDPLLPVLRFHDLFRDFLLARLGRDPARLRGLHGLAAGAESDGLRVVGHWLAAGEWRVALDRLQQAADQWLAEGGHAVLERMLERFPPAFAQRKPAWHYLTGVCAWRRWDWLMAAAAFRQAAALLDQPGHSELRPRVMHYLAGAESVLGNPAAAEAAAASLQGLALDAADRTGLELQLAWCHMSDGDAAAVVGHLREAVRVLLTAPASIAPQIADRAHSLFVGVAGALPVYRELVSACRSVAGAERAPWYGAPALIEGWTRLWEGDLPGAEAALALARSIERRFGGNPPLSDGCERLETTLLSVTGHGQQALQRVAALVETFAGSANADLSIAYAKAYLHGYARTAWACADHAAFRSIAPRAMQPRRPGEWVSIGISSRMLPAQLALLDRDWAAAADILESVLAEHEPGLFPLGHADPRLCLAHARLQQGRAADALTALERVLAQCVGERAIGWLLLEPDWLVAPLLELLPRERRAEPPLAPLLGRLADWRAEARARSQRPGPKSAGPLDLLSQREVEVLEKVAEGAGNKEIARDLALSTHTVKRHIANILGKLDCVSRRQAAMLLRRERERAGA